jgi:hypothetical protein
MLSYGEYFVFYKIFWIIIYSCYVGNQTVGDTDFDDR